jgi:hypothetical protein
MKQNAVGILCESRKKRGRDVYTLFVTLSFFPWPTYWDFATAASRRLSVLLSNGYIIIIVSAHSSDMLVRTRRERETDRCAGHSQLDLASSGAHQLAELLANTLQKTQSVIVGEGGQEVLDGVVLVRASGVLLQLGDDLGLVLGAQRRRRQDGGELGVFVVYIVQRADGLCDVVEGGVLHGCGVLFSLLVSWVVLPSAIQATPRRMPGTQGQETRGFSVQEQSHRFRRGRRGRRGASRRPVQA